MASMLRYVVVIALIGAGPAPVLCGAQTNVELAALQNELRNAELQLEETKRLFPLATQDTPVELEQFVRARGKIVALSAIELRGVAESETVLLNSGQPSPIELHRMDISGRGQYGDVHLFLNFIVKTGSRIIDFETLRLEAASGDQVSFSVRLAHAFWAPQDDAATPAMAPGANPRQRMIATVRERLIRTQSILDAVADLTERFRPERFLDALAAFSHQVGDHALALSEIRSDGDIVFKGMVLGTGARSALTAALDQAGFQLTSMAMPAGTDCQPFSVTLRLKPGEWGEKETSFRNIFDDRAAAECQTQTSPSLGRIEARGTSGALTFRLRDVDVADVFLVLHDLTTEDFVIDHDLKGRVSVEVDGATLDQIFAAMPFAGIAVGPGPLRRVRSASRPAPPLPSQSYEGEPVSFSIKNAHLEDVLCLFKNITGLPILMSRNLESRASVFADDVNWDRLLDNVIAASSLAYGLEGNRLFVGRDGDDMNTMVDACELRKPSDRWRLRPERIGAGDLKLSGLARVGDGWQAYAYAPGPSRLLLALAPDQKLFDARVKGATPEGLTLQTEGRGVITIPFGK